MSNWIKRYLGIASLLINIIRFQCSGNWDDFLKTLKKLIPF